MSEIELILAKLRIVSEEEEQGMYLCDKKHSKLLLDCITNLREENERLKKLYNEELYRRFKALKYINKNMICDALYPASKVDGENIANILNGGILNGGDE